MEKKTTELEEKAFISLSSQKVRYSHIAILYVVAGVKVFIFSLCFFHCFYSLARFDVKRKLLEKQKSEQISVKDNILTLR